MSDLVSADPSDKVKSLHARLRRSCQLRESEEGAEDHIWREHLSREQELQDYAEAMHRMATEKWTKRRTRKKKR